MLSRREQIIRQLVAHDVHDVAQDVARGLHDDLVALLTNGFVGYARMSDEQLEAIWRTEVFGKL